MRKALSRHEFLKVKELKYSLSINLFENHSPAGLGRAACGGGGSSCSSIHRLLFVFRSSIPNRGTAGGVPKAWREGKGRTIGTVRFRWVRPGVDF